MLREKRKDCLWEREVEKKAGGGKESNGGREREVLKNPSPFTIAIAMVVGNAPPIRVGDIHRGAIRSVGWAEAKQKANEGCAAINKQPDTVILSDRRSL